MSESKRNASGRKKVKSPLALRVIKLFILSELGITMMMKIVMILKVTCNINVNMNIVENQDFNPDGELAKALELKDLSAAQACDHSFHYLLKTYYSH